MFSLIRYSLAGISDTFMIIYAVDTKTKATVQLWFILTTTQTHTYTLISLWLPLSPLPSTDWFIQILHIRENMSYPIIPFFFLSAHTFCPHTSKICSGIKGDESGRNSHTRREDGHTFHWNNSHSLSSYMINGNLLADC